MSLPNQNPLFHRAFEDAGIAMALVGLDGRFKHVNRALCQLLGYEADELEKRTFQEITHPDDLETDLSHVRELFEGGAEAYQLRKRYVDRPGNIIHVLLTVSLIRDEAGSPRMFISQIQEMAAMKLREAAEARFELPVALHFVAGYDGYFKKLSSNSPEILGRPKEELLARPYLDFVHPDDLKRTVTQARMVAEGEEAVLFENRYSRADGSYRWLLWTALPVPSEKLIYGVAIDFTERKQIETELEAALREHRRLYSELHAATAHIRELRQGLVKICAWTKQVHIGDRWIRTEDFLREHLQLNLTHGISDEAAAQFLKDLESEGLEDRA